MLERGRRRSGGYANWLMCQWHVSEKSAPMAKISPTDDNADDCISGDSYRCKRGFTLLCSDFCQAPILRIFT